MKLDVPYHSQFLDVKDPFWMLRACGATSFLMVTNFLHNKKEADILSFCLEAKERGGYHMVNGWIHDFLVAKAHEEGFSARRVEGLLSCDELYASLDKGFPVIVSVEKRVLEQKRFHMIVLTGYEGDTFFYHEPESTDPERGSHRICDNKTFMEYWRGKAIFITR